MYINHKIILKQPKRNENQIVMLIAIENSDV